VLHAAPSPDAGHCVAPAGRVTGSVAGVHAPAVPGAHERAALLTFAAGIVVLAGDPAPTGTTLSWLAATATIADTSATRAFRRDMKTKTNRRSNCKRPSSSRGANPAKGGASNPRKVPAGRRRASRDEVN
jgi:hypothetical protein